MKSKRTKQIGMAILALVAIAVSAPNAVTRTSANLSASVVDQVCQGGNGVAVTLTADLQPAKRGVLFEWDLNNDGIFDTAPSRNPMITNVYGDELLVTARVRASKGSRSAEATVTFETIRCP